MRGLEQIPACYDAAMALLDRGLLGRWRTSLAEPPGGPLLEVGCGTGRTLALQDGSTDAPRPRAPESAGADPVPDDRKVVGIDPDAAVLRAARRRAPGALLIRARAEALPFRDGSFQVVVSSLSFCSVDDPTRGLVEVARVLRPGGRLRMLEHVRPRSRAGAILARLLRGPWRTLTGGCRLDRDTEATVRSAGFRIDPATRQARWLLRRLDASPPPGGAGSIPSPSGSAVDTPPEGREDR